MKNRPNFATRNECENENNCSLTESRAVLPVWADPSREIQHGKKNSVRTSQGEF